MPNSKNLSALAESVLALDTHFAELNRLSSQIENLEFISDTDIERAQRLINLFAENAQGVASGVVQMSKALNEAREAAENAARMVSSRAEELQKCQTERQKKLEQFRQLGEKVQALNNSLNNLKRPDGDQISESDRAAISMRFSELDIQLRPLIEEAQAIRSDAQSSKMSLLEQNAHSLQQSLTALSKKLASFQETPGTLQ